MRNATNKPLSKKETRAEWSFVLYCELGPERSLGALHARLVEFGVTISSSTLRRYSVEFDWARRAAERDVEVASLVRKKLEIGGVADVIERRRRSKFASALGTRILRDIASDPRRLARASVRDGLRLVEGGLRLEPTEVELGGLDRSQVYKVIEELLTYVGNAFERANTYEEREVRLWHFQLDVNWARGEVLKRHGLAMESEPGGRV